MSLPLDTPQHVIVGGRKMLEMVGSNQELLKHVIPGIARLGRGVQWMVVGHRMVNVAEISNWLVQQGGGLANGLNAIERAAHRGVDSLAPFIRLIEYDGRNDWQNGYPDQVRAGFERELGNHMYNAGQHTLEAAKATARGVGKFMQGDLGGSIEEGAKAVEQIAGGFFEYWTGQSYQETLNDFWSRN